MLSVIALIAIPQESLSDWAGPQEVVIGIWGSEPGQFYFGAGDNIAFDEFPRNFGVDKNGMTLISDSGNKRIQIFTANGSLSKVITPPAELPARDSLRGWPSELTVFNGGNSFVVSCESQKGKVGYKKTKECFLDYNGIIAAKVLTGEVYLIPDGYIIFNYNDKTYYRYSPTGTLISTSPTKPPELGQVTEKRIGKKEYQITVKYPDKEWVIISDKSIGYGVANPYRDINGNLYLVYSKKVEKYDDKGKVIGELSIPANEGEKGVIPPGYPGNAEPPRGKIIAQYGNPIMAPNGDIYTWMRSDTHYKILKWTWQN